MFFPDWSSCCGFVQDHISEPVSLKGNTLGVHFVLQHMSLEFSEVRMCLLLVTFEQVRKQQNLICAYS